MSSNDERQEPVIPDAMLAVDADERAVRSQNRSPSQNVRIAGRKKNARRNEVAGAWFGIGPMLLALLVVGGLVAYLVWNARAQQVRDDELITRLDAAAQRITALEGELSATGESLSESGTEVEGKVGTLEHEIRKLWDVSNKRNRQWIEANQSALEKLRQASGTLKQSISGDLAALGKTLEQVQAERKQESEAYSEMKAGFADLPALRQDLETVTAQASRLDQSSAALKKESATSRAELEAALKKLEDSQLSMQARSDQFGVQLTRLNAALARLEQQVAASKGGSGNELDALRKALAENEQSVRSMDAFRRQTNQSITSLQTAVSNLQKQN